MDTLTSLFTWLANLDPAFAFLLAVPFVVAACGLAIELRPRRTRRPVRAAGRDIAGDALHHPR
jgi:hypothetical protein